MLTYEITFYCGNGLKSHNDSPKLVVERNSWISPTYIFIILQAMCILEVYDKLVRYSDWSPDEYQGWLARNLKRLLLEA
jgi:hypothetical protein